MSGALAEALVAAQRRTLSAMEKWYVAGAIDGLVARRDGLALSMLAASLTNAEREYVTGKLGPAALERLYGVGR